MCPGQYGLSQAGGTFQDNGPLCNPGCLDHGNGSHTWALVRFEIKQISFPDMPQRTSVAGWQEAKIYVMSPEIFFFQLRITWQQKCPKGSEDNFLLKTIGLGTWKGI